MAERAKKEKRKRERKKEERKVKRAEMERNQVGSCVSQYMLLSRLSE